MTRDELYAALGQRIRRAREARGLTQDDLAAAVSLTRTSITNIERGRQKLLPHTLCEIAIVLHVEPSEILPRLADLVRSAEVPNAPQDLQQELAEPLSEREWEWIRSAIAPPNRRG